MPRLRRFSTRVLGLVVGLLCTALVALWWLISNATLRSAIEHSEANLEIAGRTFDEATRQRIELLVGNAKTLTNDYVFKQTIVQSDDPASLADALRGHAESMGVPLIALFRPEGQLWATSEGGLSEENQRPFAQLIHDAARDDREQASGFALLANRLHLIVVVPFYAPYPNVKGWFGLVFSIDEAFARKIRATTQVEVTFVSTESLTSPRVFASTLPDDIALLSARAAAGSVTSPLRLLTLEMPADRYVTLLKLQRMVGRDSLTIVLQRSLSAELIGTRELQNFLLLVSLAALGLATLVALAIARSVSQPVLQLAEHTKHIAAGDYEKRIELPRADELGQLATAFNEMSAGLAERDRVRDLLDKNVSPEVAAQLLRDGAALGGEIRAVTILFADLRGFTTMSERLPPHDLLQLLNRYLDRMSAEIERHGGIIDKFIGDEIMALFGAPVVQDDSAARALSAALAMERALAKLNAELAAEAAANSAANLPTALGVGIGINTARVVAGNMGTHRRQNYSVIGDGVNIAARLQSLTRTADYRTNIITSAATVAALRDPKAFTLRALGRAQVKGRGEPVEVFALDQS